MRLTGWAGLAKLSTNPSNPTRLLLVEMQRWVDIVSMFRRVSSSPYPFVAALSLPPPSPFCHSERSEESAVRPSGAPLLTAHHFHQIIQYSETTPFRGQLAPSMPVPRNGSNVRTMRTRFSPRKILGSGSPVGRLISSRRKWCVVCAVSYTDVEGTGRSNPRSRPWGLLRPVPEKAPKRLCLGILDDLVEVVGRQKRGNTKGALQIPRCAPTARRGRRNDKKGKVAARTGQRQKDRAISKARSRTVRSTKSWDLPPT